MSEYIKNIGKEQKPLRTKISKKDEKLNATHTEKGDLLVEYFTTFHIDNINDNSRVDILC